MVLPSHTSSSSYPSPPWSSPSSPPTRTPRPRPRPRPRSTNTIWLVQVLVLASAQDSGCEKTEKIIGMHNAHHILDNGSSKRSTSRSSFRRTEAVAQSRSVSADYSKKKKLSIKCSSLTRAAKNVGTGLSSWASGLTSLPPSPVASFHGDSHLDLQSRSRS